MPTVLRSIATANPALGRSQEYAASFMQRITSLPDRIRTRIPAIYERSAIGYRHSCVEDYALEPDAFGFFPPNWDLAPAPGTAARNDLYREKVMPMAEQASRDALHRAGLTPADVTHVVTVSCTGFFAPGPDIELVKRLGMRSETERVHIGFMGCYAAFNALRVAHAFCSMGSGARVLVVCAELCTLHFQIDDTLESAVVNALFADGAAAAVLTDDPVDAARGLLTYEGGACRLDDDSMEDMTWTIGDTGFRMGLSSRVPRILARHLPDYLVDLLEPHGLNASDVDFWAIHPGGRAIVDEAQAVLGLPDDAVADSLGVLKEFGNMSSPTVLFVLQRILDRHQVDRAAGRPGYGVGVAMAFGPGLTLEGCVFRSGDG